jgi:hypothetical protein
VIRVFIGFDQVESVAYHVFEYSIHRRSSVPVTSAPVRLSQLKGVLYRDRHPLQTNDFSFSRWLVPWLCNFDGWALFADCDILCRGDIAELWALRDDSMAVQVVKHHHKPLETVKYLGLPQTPYARKNWSSVMLFNCAKCTQLTPGYVNSANGLDLHQFRWLGNDDLIGELPKEWNHLVGYDKPNKNAKFVHYTTGGPWLYDYAGCEYTSEWLRERDKMMGCQQNEKS